MTLINIIRRQDRVWVISDGAAIDDDARMVAVGSKVVFMPIINAVIACRGNGMVAAVVMNALAGNCASFGTFDGLRNSLVATVRSMFDAAGPNWIKLQGADALKIDIVVAGFAETGGTAAYMLRTLEGSSIPAWEIVDIECVLLTPSNDAIAAKTGKSLCDQARGLTDKEIIAVAELQRKHIEPHGSKHIPTSWVGGFLQLTTITEREISTRIIHRWDDQIGIFLRG